MTKIDTISDRQKYLDLYEIAYENARDAGYPIAAAQRVAEIEASNEMAKVYCPFCDSEVDNDHCYCARCGETF